MKSPPKLKILRLHFTQLTLRADVVMQLHCPIVHSSAACTGTTPMTTASCSAQRFARHRQQSLIKTNKQSKSTHIKKRQGKIQGGGFLLVVSQFLTINRSCILTGRLYKPLYLASRAWISSTQYPFSSIPASSVLSAFSISHPLLACLTLLPTTTHSHTFNKNAHLAHDVRAAKQSAGY